MRGFEFETPVLKCKFIQIRGVERIALRGRRSNFHQMIEKR